MMVVMLMCLQVPDGQCPGKLHDQLVMMMMIVMIILVMMVMLMCLQMT